MNSVCLLLRCQCSRSCGKGLQMREVRCLTPGKKHSQECDSTTRPEQEQFCNTLPCSPHVQGWCVSWCWLCVCARMCVCHNLVTLIIRLLSSFYADENCRDRRHNCVMVVQARLCVYSYYKAACCASCAQSAQRAKRQWPTNHRRAQVPFQCWSPLKCQICRNGQPEWT